MEIKAKDGCVYEFPSHKWLASNSGDGKTSRELNGKSRCRNLDAPSKGKENISISQSGNEQIVENALHCLHCTVYIHF